MRPLALPASLLAVCVLAASPARAMPSGPTAAQQASATGNAAPAVLQAVDVQEQLGAEVPRDAVLLDEEGRRVALGDVLSSERPTVLSLVYYECPALCSLVLNGMVKSLREVKQTLGEDYQVVSVSIDPKDTPLKSQQRRRHQLQALGAPQAAPWHFLTGEEAQVRRIADAVGFRYAYDVTSGQYAHPAVLMVLTPRGRVSRYLYGVDFPSRDMGFALLEAGQGRVGTTLERVVLSCFQYDASAKRYSFYILGFLRIAGTLMLGALATVLLVSWRREKKRGEGAGGA